MDVGAEGGCPVHEELPPRGLLDAPKATRISATIPENQDQTVLWCWRTRAVSDFGDDGDGINPLGSTGEVSPSYTHPIKSLHIHP